MLLSKLNIKNFRCFEQIELELNSQLILIEVKMARARLQYWKHCIIWAIYDHSGHI